MDENKDILKKFSPLPLVLPPYLVMVAALQQPESSLGVSQALMSEEIRRSRCYVAGTRDGVAEIHAAGLSSLLWDDFLSLFLSCRLLQT